jgi:hypothetical protein
MLDQKPFALCAAIMARAPPKMDIAPVGAVVMAALTTTEMVDRLAAYGFGL